MYYFEKDVPQSLQDSPDTLLPPEPLDEESENFEMPKVELLKEHFRNALLWRVARGGVTL